MQGIDRKGVLIQTRQIVGIYLWKKRYPRNSKCKLELKFELQTSFTTIYIGDYQVSSIEFTVISGKELSCREFNRKPKTNSNPVLYRKQAQKSRNLEDLVVNTITIWLRKVFYRKFPKFTQYQKQRDKIRKLKERNQIPHIW